MKKTRGQKSHATVPLMSDDSLKKLGPSMPLTNAGTVGFLKK